jgi:hypothetical protein
MPYKDFPFLDLQRHLPPTHGLVDGQQELFLPKGLANAF